jgi:hypothetical protein
MGFHHLIKVSTISTTESQKRKLILLALLDENNFGIFYSTKVRLNDPTIPVRPRAYGTKSFFDSQTNKICKAAKYANKKDM